MNIFDQQQLQGLQGPSSLQLPRGTQAPQQPQIKQGWQGKAKDLMGNPIFMMGLGMAADPSNRLASGAKYAYGASEYKSLQEQQAEQKSLRDLQMKAEQSKLKKMKSREDALNKLLPTLDPQQAILAQLDPDKFTSEMISQGFAQPDLTSVQKNAQMLHPNDPEAQRRYVQEVTMKPGTTVNVGGNDVQTGTIPPGYYLAQTPDGGLEMKVIPGSPEAREMETLGAKADASQETEENKASLQMDVLNDAREKILANPSTTTGMAAQVLSRFGGTEAKDVNELLKTLKANVSFDYLQTMRDNSPTGGALGQVSERELDLLGATINSIEQSQSADQLVNHLNTLEKQLIRVIHGNEAAQNYQAPAERRRFKYNPNTGVLE